MKKLFSLLFLCCYSIAAWSQLTTVTVNSTGPVGSYKSGYINNVSPATRNDGNIQVHNSPSDPIGTKRGWAVFDLRTHIPPSATVDTVRLRFTIKSTANTDNAITVGIFGAAQDISTVTNADTVYAHLNGYPYITYGGLKFNNAQWGSSPGTDLLLFNTTGRGFINTNYDTVVTIGWQCNSNPGQTYTIVGDTGSASTQPQLQITYECNGVNSVAALTSPNPVCAGDSLTLTAAGVGTTTYKWTGPSGFTSTLQNPKRLMSAATAGVYTLTAYNAGGCPTTVYSNSVTVNPLPAAITASPNYLCVNSSVTVSDATPLGTWSATSTTVATVNVNTGVVKGVSPGNAVIKFTLPTSCFVTQSITIVAPPATITGSATVCQGQGTTLSIASIGGTWSSSNLTIATVMPTTLYTPTAVVTGASMGSVTITYAVGFDCYSVKSMTVYPRAEITGRDSVCKGNTTYLANIVGGGTWSSSNTSFVTIGSTDGFVTGVNTGISRITYSTPLGCLSTVSMTVIAFPAPITGTMHTCPGASTILRDATLNGTWSSDNNGVATVNPATGVVYGAFADTVTINYTVKPGCSVSALVLVNPNPAPITGTDSLCVLTADTLHDGTPSGVWSTSTSSIATIDTNGVLHATVGGNSVVSYTLPVTGCKATRTFTVNPLPVPIITYDHANATLHTDTFYKHYQWSGSIGGDIPGANSTSTAALYTMYYYVTVVDNHGCVGTSAPYYFDETLLNVGNVGASGIKVFPNPATESIYITSPVRVRAVVSGIDGRQQIDQADAKNIDISRLADGIYFVTLYNDDNHPIAIRKIVKQ